MALWHYRAHMSASATARLEAFCDGVFAIALTLLIIEVKLPALPGVETTAAFWRAIGHLMPTVFAFGLSFTIIFITWVNHHGGVKLVNKSSAPFIYANGVLLLAVVAIPFPTSVLGEFLFTDHAAPGGILYNGVLVLLAIGWILFTSTAISGGLACDERSEATLRENRRNGFGAIALYSVLAVTAVWFPLAVAITTTLSWIFWLILGIRLRHA